MPGDDVIYQPWDYPHMTSREKITSLILSGVQRSANHDTINTYGDLFREVDRMLELVTFKDEGDTNDTSTVRDKVSST